MITKKQKLELLTTMFDQQPDLSKLSPEILNSILQNKDNEQFLSELQSAIEISCKKQGGGSRRMSKALPGQWSKNNSRFKSQQKEAKRELKLAQRQRDVERLARQKLGGIDNTEKNIGDLLDKQMNKLLKDKSKEISFLSQNFKTLQLIDQIKFIDSFNTVIEQIDFIDDSLNDLFHEGSVVTFDEHHPRLFKTLEKINKAFEKTPFNGAFANTVDYVRSSWKDYTWKSMNIGNILGVDINIPLPNWTSNTLTIIDNEVINKSINDLGPHINQLENEAMNSTILKGLKNRRQQAILRKIQSITNPDDIPPFIEHVSGWMEDDAAQEVINEAFRTRASKTPENMRTRFKTVRLDTGKLIDQYDYGASLVPDVVKQGKSRSGGPPGPSVFPPVKGKQSAVPLQIGEYDYGANIVPVVVKQGKSRSGGPPGPSVFPPPLFRPTKTMVLLIGQSKVLKPKGEVTTPQYVDLIKIGSFDFVKVKQNVLSFDRCVNDVSLIIVLLRLMRKLTKPSKSSRKKPRRSARSVKSSSSASSTGVTQPAQGVNSSQKGPLNRKMGPLNMTRANNEYNFLNDPNPPSSVKSSSPNYSSSAQQSSIVQSPRVNVPVRRVQSAPGVLRARSKLSSQTSSRSSSPVPRAVSQKAATSEKQSSNNNSNNQSRKALTEYNKFVNLCNRGICSLDLYREYYVSEVKDVNSQIDKLNKQKQLLQTDSSYSSRAQSQSRLRKMAEQLKNFNEYIKYVEEEDTRLLAMIDDIEKRKTSPKKTDIDSIKTHTQQLKNKYKEFIVDSRCDNLGKVKANKPNPMALRKKQQIRSVKRPRQLSQTPKIPSRKASRSASTSAASRRSSSTSASAASTRSSSTSASTASRRSSSNNVQAIQTLSNALLTKPVKQVSAECNQDNSCNIQPKFAANIVKLMNELENLKRRLKGHQKIKSKRARHAVIKAQLRNINKIEQKLIDLGVDEEIFGSQPDIVLSNSNNIHQTPAVPSTNGASIPNNHNTRLLELQSGINTNFIKMKELMSSLSNATPPPPPPVALAPAALAPVVLAPAAAPKKKTKKPKPQSQSSQSARSARVAQARREAMNRDRGGPKLLKQKPKNT